MSALNIVKKLAPAAYLTNEVAGRVWLFLGKPERAIHSIRIALDANPLVMNTNGLLAYALACNGEVDAALALINEMRQLDPGNSVIQNYFAWIHAAHGDAELACNIGAGVCKQLPRSANSAAVYAFALASAGRARESRPVLSSLQDTSCYPTREGAISSQAWRTLGDPQEAVAALVAGAEDRDYWLGMMLQHPANAVLRTEPGFSEVFDFVFNSKPASDTRMQLVTRKDISFPATAETKPGLC